MLRHHHQPVRSAVPALSLTRPAPPLLALLLIALAVLAGGCGTSSGDNVAQAQSADAVHQGWVEAMRNGDADTALALTDPDLPERAQFARDAVGRMQEYLTSPASPTGALEHVTVEPVSDGLGRSVWQFARKRWCYRAELVSRGERWFISRWGQTSVDCT